MDAPNALVVTESAAQRAGGQDCPPPLVARVVQFRASAIVGRTSMVDVHGVRARSSATAPNLQGYCGARGDWNAPSYRTHAAFANVEAMIRRAHDQGVAGHDVDDTAHLRVDASAALRYALHEVFSRE